eukprot:gene2164-4160_t
MTKKSFKADIRRVLKGLKGNFRISKKAMAICNYFAEDLFERIAGEAGRAASYAGANTMDARILMHALRLVTRGGLRDAAMTASAKAVCRYTLAHDAPDPVCRRLDF